jgi:threonine dehydratase
MSQMNVYEETLQAHERIKGEILETDLRSSALLSDSVGASVYLKLENLQHTGSFKARGAINKLLSMPESEREKGVIAASTGNHGAAVAWGLSRAGGRGIVYVTETAPAVKVKAIERWGAEVRRHAADAVKTEARAREVAAAEGLTFISPYNDPHIVAGGGTIGVELVRRLERIDAVIVPVGGGGLISGVAGYLKEAHPGAEIIGCSPENSQVMIQSVMAGRILDLPSEPTLSDATAGGIEPGSITFDLCAEFVDSFIAVSEDEIRGALLEFEREEGMLIEGAGALPVAAFGRLADRLGGANVVLIVSGGNIDPDWFNRSQ